MIYWQLFIDWYTFQVMFWTFVPWDKAKLQRYAFWVVYRLTSDRTFGSPAHLGLLCLQIRLFTEGKWKLLTIKRDWVLINILIENYHNIFHASHHHVFHPNIIFMEYPLFSSTACNRGRLFHRLPNLSCVIGTFTPHLSDSPFYFVLVRKRSVHSSLVNFFLQLYPKNNSPEGYYQEIWVATQFFWRNVGA